MCTPSLLQTRFGMFSARADRGRPGLPKSDFLSIIRWQSVSNKLYTLQAATNLVVGFTTNLLTNITATPPMNVHTNSVGSANQMFYRIEVE